MGGGRSRHPHGLSADGSWAHGERRGSIVGSQTRGRVHWVGVRIVMKRPTLEPLVECAENGGGGTNGGRGQVEKMRARRGQALSGRAWGRGWVGEQGVRTEWGGDEMRVAGV